MIVRRYFQYRQNFNNLIIFHLNKRNYSFKNDFVHSKAPNINLTRSLIHEHIWCSIEKWPEKTAVVSMKIIFHIIFCMKLKQIILDMWRNR